MSARTLPPSGREAAENELLSRLGLTPAASPEDVDQIHEAVSEYLAAAPASIRGWAHAQAAALDAAYLQLTDPVGFEGSALRSPTRPPRVAPGGPATPPARRAPLPVAPPTPAENLDDLEADAGDDDEDLAALYASVTPSAHEDMGPERRRAKSHAARPTPAPAPVLPPQAGGNGWKKVALGVLALALVVGIAFAGYALGGGGAQPGAVGDTAQATPTAPVIDESKVADLMGQLQANPRDTAVLLALADEFYAGGQYDTAATWLDKLLAIDPEHIQGLLARGAVSFNLGDLDAAETTWSKVAALAPDNQEVHYDLGFLFLNQATPDWAGVQREWTRVIEIDPTTSLAQTAQQHLDSLVASSMIPAASPAASGSPVPSPAASPAASPATSPAASPAVSPAASPAESIQP